MSDVNLLDALPSSKSAEQQEADLRARDAAQGEAERQRKATEEITRLRDAEARLTPIRDLADALDEDPSKIYDLRAALEGRAAQAAPSTQPTTQPQQGLSKEQIDALNDQIRDNPLQAVAELADTIARSRLAEFQRQAQPVLDATADSFVEGFRTRKSGSDPLYKKVEASFEREVGDLDRSTLLGMTSKARQAELERRYDAATAKVLRAAMSTTPSSADTSRNLGSGSSGGGETPSQKSSYWDEHPRLVALARATGLVSKEDMEEIERTLDASEGELF